MRPSWMRYRKWCVALSCGGVTLGILQAFEMLNFADLITGFLTVWLSALVTILFGGDVSNYL